MMRTTAKKAARLFKGTSMFVGAAVMLAVILGIGSAALAANGKPFLLGKNNAATAITTLVKQGPGPALRLLVRPGQPPMTVNSPVKVANLNSDKVDGKDSTSFLAANGKATDAAHADEADTADTADTATTATNADNATNAQNAANATNANNADTLDGKNSTDFAAASSEAWKPISASGTTPFDRFYGGWQNFDGTHSTAAYYKDAQGTVHLKGVVRSGSFGACCFNTETGMVFLLPQGYWPAQQKVFTVLTGPDNTVARVDVGRGGCYGTANIPSGTCGAAVQAVSGNPAWISLDGISFRADG